MVGGREAGPLAPPNAPRGFNRRMRAFESLVAFSDSRVGRLALVNNVPACGEASPGSDGPLASPGGPGSQSRRGERRTEAANSPDSSYDAAHLYLTHVRTATAPFIVEVTVNPAHLG